jgi:putative ABC transport system substrate-binding protein
LKRREFVAGTLCAMTLPSAPLAQKSIPAVGVLGIFPLDAPDTPAMSGIRKGLAEAGFREGPDVTIQTRWTAGMKPDQLLAFASDLVRQPVSVLVATGSAGVAQTAKQATTTIPIVFANGSDPVRVGLVASINRPGGNATGISFFTSSLGPKRLELLREIAPRADKIAFLVNPSNPVTEGDIGDMESAARTVGQTIAVVKAANESEIEAAFAAMVREQASALIVNVDAFFNSRRHQIAALAARHKLPASYNTGQYVTAGGLMSYGDDRVDSYRQVGIYVGRILKGEKPGDLPVMQPTKFQLVINLKAATALGLVVPPTLLARADRVIE